MILSGRDIDLYIKHNQLVIDPVNKDQFRQNGVDLVLSDLRQAVDADELNNDFQYSIDHPQRFRKYGMFYLGATREHLELPTDMMAFVALRSTWARKGILIPMTVVDAGFRGNLTLEIVSFNDFPVPYGERFAHLIYAKMTSPSDPYQGKYQGQSGITPGKQD